MATMAGVEPTQEKQKPQPQPLDLNRPEKEILDPTTIQPDPDTVGSPHEGDVTEQGSYLKAITERRVSLPKALYRKPLPESCIAFASDEGKRIFMEALMSGHMNCYFHLASQFRTQDEPAYCGLATLIMVLNALEIDPGRVWKGPWKWYHEDMLDCCVPTELVRKQGITFDEFICIADCNSMDTRAVRVDKGASLEDFRDLVMEMTRREDRFLIVSYSRPMLDQTGDGHFAPISGYHPERDLVLILDTARFKYPPHWIKLPQLFEAMKGLDSSTGLPRGYVEMWPAKDGKALLLFKIAREFSVNADPHIVENFQLFLSAWTDLLNRPSSELFITAEGGNHKEGNKEGKGDAVMKQREGGGGGDMNMNMVNGDAKSLQKEVGEKGVVPLRDVLSVVVRGLIEAAGTLNKQTFVLNTQEHVSCASACSVQCAVDDLLSSLEATDTFRIVNDLVEKLPPDDVAKLQNLFGEWPNICSDHKSWGGGEVEELGKSRFGCSKGGSFSAMGLLEKNSSALGLSDKSDSALGLSDKNGSALSLSDKNGSTLGLSDKNGSAMGPLEKNGSVMGLTVCCDMNQSLCLCHFIATFLLSWPYSMSPVPDPNPTSAAAMTTMSLKLALKYYLCNDLRKGKNKFLQDEMFTLRRQLRKLMGFHSTSATSPGKESSCCKKNNESCRESKFPYV